jgi:hypothetical protein
LLGVCRVSSSETSEPLEDPAVFGTSGVGRVGEDGKEKRALEGFWETVVAKNLFSK